MIFMRNQIRIYLIFVCCFDTTDKKNLKSESRAVKSLYSHYKIPSDLRFTIYDLPLQIVIRVKKAKKNLSISRQVFLYSAFLLLLLK